MKNNPIRTPDHHPFFERTSSEKTNVVLEKPKEHRDEVKTKMRSVSRQRLTLWQRKH